MNEKLNMSLQCPLPKLDFEVITLGHGSGGVLTSKLLESGVFEILKNPLLDQKHDGAVFELDGKVAFSTDSYVISPLFFPGGNIGDLAVNGTVNDLAMCGAIPKYLSLSFILEEGFRMDEFWEILLTIKHCCDKAGVQVVTGDTKVVEKGKGDKIFINTSGIGLVHPKAEIHSNRIENGDMVVLSHEIAAHGMAIMSVREGLEFETEIVSDTCNLNLIVKDLLDQFGNDIKLMRDPTRGGVGTVLNEIARDCNYGIDIEQAKVPVDEQVFGACELLGLDPLYVANEGVFMAIVSKTKASEVKHFLQNYPSCSKAAIIGEITEQHRKQVIQKSAIGGKRVVNMLVGEQLPRIC